MTFEEWWGQINELPWSKEWQTVDYARVAWVAAATFERERCAKLVETAGAYTDWNEYAVDVAAQIRAGEG